MSASIWALSAPFGVCFVLAAWLLRSRRVTAGAVFAGILCLFEILHYPSWPKHGASATGPGSGS